MLKLLRILPAVLVLTLAFPALAQSRGPVLPNFQQPDAPQPAPSAPASRADEVDLVGPTEAQQRRTRAAAESRERALVESNARVEAEARAAAEARRKLEREDAEALAQHQRGEAEARRQQLRDQAVTRALAAIEAKARAHESAVEKARLRALAQARRGEETRCARKKSKKLQGDCRAVVAARYEPAPLGLPATGLPATGLLDDSLALAPLVASPPDRRGPNAVFALAHDDRKGGVCVASATLEPSATANGFTPVPREEIEGARGRHAEVRNDLQIGPQSLVLNHLAARAELSPGSLQAGFTYRLVLDDAGAAHHLFGASLESARCPDDAGCGLRWFGFAGLSPSASQGFPVQGGVNGRTTSHTDQLGWSAAVGAAGLSYSGRLLSFAADGQLEALSIDYSRNTETSPPPAATSGTLDQVRLRGTAGIASGAWSGSLRIAGYVYAGEAPETFQLAPLRGALVDDDTAGLAGAPQSFQARLEGRYDSTSGLSLQASYGYLSYVGPYWTSANLVAASVSQRLGHFRVGFGLVYEGESDRSGASYPTLFGTGTLGASF